MTPESLVPFLILYNIKTNIFLLRIVFSTILYGYVSIGRDAACNGPLDHNSRGPFSREILEAQFSLVHSASEGSWADVVLVLLLARKDWLWPLFNFTAPQASHLAKHYFLSFHFQNSSILFLFIYFFFQHSSFFFLKFCKKKKKFRVNQKYSRRQKWFFL